MEKININNINEKDYINLLIRNKKNNIHQIAEIFDEGIEILDQLKKGNIENKNILKFLIFSLNIQNEIINSVLRKQILNKDNDDIKILSKQKEELNLSYLVAINIIGCIIFYITLSRKRSSLQLDR